MFCFEKGIAIISDVSIPEPFMLCNSVSKGVLLPLITLGTVLKAFY